LQACQASASLLALRIAALERHARLCGAALFTVGYLAGWTAFSLIAALAALILAEKHFSAGALIARVGAVAMIGTSALLLWG
jgi:predicted metal-binding membrane protein